MEMRKGKRAGCKQINGGGGGRSVGMNRACYLRYCTFNPTAST